MMNINPMQFMQQLNQLKSKGGDPNQMIQQMLNSGRVSQAQYDAAVKLKISLIILILIFLYIRIYFLY